MQHIYRLPSQRSRGILHSSTIKDSHRQKNLFSCALYKEKAIQLFEHKRKSIPLDDGGNGIFMCSGSPPPNSCMIYLGQSKWPEDRKKKKSESPYVQSYKKDLIQALSYHLRKRQGPLCVKDSSLELLCLKAWKTGTDSELEINNLLNNSWYLPDLKSCANEARWDFIPISSLEMRTGCGCPVCAGRTVRMTRLQNSTWAPGTQQGDWRHSLNEK